MLIRNNDCFLYALVTFCVRTNKNVLGDPACSHANFHMPWQEIAIRSCCDPAFVFNFVFYFACATRYREASSRHACEPRRACSRVFIQMPRRAKHAEAAPGQPCVIVVRHLACCPCSACFALCVKTCLCDATPGNVFEPCRRAALRMRRAKHAEAAPGQPMVQFLSATMRQIPWL